MQEVNVNLIPSYKDFFKAFQSPPNNTVGGKHYGVSLQFGPNMLLYNTKRRRRSRRAGPRSTTPKNKGKITIPDNPIQIADAALYLSKTKPSLGITDPYELTKAQLAATVALLKQQRPLDEEVLGARRRPDRPVQERRVDPRRLVAVPVLAAARPPRRRSATVIPKEGVTGWLDTWMLSSKAKHPNCAYKWMQYITSPKVQAQQATNYGETPVNKKACAYHGHALEGLLHPVLREPPGVVLPDDQVLEDAARRMRQRQEGLHRPHGPGRRPGTQIKG